MQMMMLYTHETLVCNHSESAERWNHENMFSADLVQVELDMVSGPQAVGGDHLMDHVPPCQDNSLHGIQDILTDRRHSWRQTSPGHPVGHLPTIHLSSGGSADLQSIPGEVALVM